MNNIKPFFKGIKSVAAASLLLAVFFIFAGVSSVQAGPGITFSWRANPVEDNVVGYRLYFGQESRYTSSSYDYYIDFTSWEYCPAGQDGVGCSPLAADSVTCQDLFREMPKCTVYGLSGQMYYAMTAYNTVSESGYTQELSLVADNTSNQITSARAGVLQQVYSLLLYNKK